MNKEELEKLAEQGDEEAKMSLAETLTVRERLLRRKEHNTVFVEFADDLGAFKIEVKLLSPAEQNEVLKMYGELVAYQNSVKDISKDDKDAQKEFAEKGTAVMGKLYGWIEKICVDPELDAEYWKAGADYNIDVPLTLLRFAMSESQKASEDIRSFRSNRARQRIIPVSDGKPSDT